MPVRIRKNQWELFDKVKPKLDKHKVKYRITPKGRNIIFETIDEYDFFRYLYEKEVKKDG